MTDTSTHLKREKKEERRKKKEERRKKTLQDFGENPRQSI